MRNTRYSEGWTKPVILGDMDAIKYAPAQMHSQTSIAAAEAILPEAPIQSQIVYDVLKGAGEHGLTDQGIAASCAGRVPPESARARRVWLVEKGYVVDSGIRRKTRSGRMAVVWRIA